MPPIKIAALFQDDPSLYLVSEYWLHPWDRVSRVPPTPSLGAFKKDILF